MRLLISMGILVPFAFGTVVMLIWWQRKLLGDIQMRLGPTAHGPFGLLQLIFDGLKLVAKENILPSKADKMLYIVAPFLVFVPALATFLTIPFYKTIVVRDLDIGIFYFFAIATILPVGLIIAGWASFNKYTVIGGIRAAAQQLTYEVPLLLSTMGVIICAGSLSMVSIVEAQSKIWFIILQPFGFVLFYVTMLAELNKPPFDLPEAESELVSGYFTEYTGMKFAFFLFGETAMVFTMSALVTVLFLGGWYSPFMMFEKYLPQSIFYLVNGAVPGVIWFMLKTLFMVFTVFWVQGTAPRVRIDQLMDLGWKILLPLSILNLMATAVVITIAKPF